MTVALAGGDETITVIVANPTAQTFSRPIHAAVRLRRLAGTEEFWAPVVLSTARPQPPNSPELLVLPPYSGRAHLILPHTLLWARAISSVWPNQPLAAVVPEGRYLLAINVSGHATNELAVYVTARGAVVPDDRGPDVR